MTKERAKYLLENCVKINGNEFVGFYYKFHVQIGVHRMAQRDDGMTQEEYEYAKTFWSMMSKDSSLYDAIMTIGEM